MKTIKTVLKVRTNPIIAVFFLLMLGMISCSKDDEPEIKLSSEKQITSFIFLLTDNPIDVNVVATIDEENKTITATMPLNVSITTLLPEIKLSDKASIDLTTAQDFIYPVAYTVTAEDGSTMVYTVTITLIVS